MLAGIGLVALLPAITILQRDTSSTVYAAAASPTISMPANVHPFDTVTITGVGFYAGDSVVITIDNPNNYPLTTLHCDSSGNCSGEGTIPNRYVPQGTHLTLSEMAV